MARVKKQPGIRLDEDPGHWSTRLPPLSRLGVKDKISMFKYLAVMTEAGIPIEKALIAVHNQARSTLMHRIMHRLLNDVASGEFLSASMAKMPKIFEPLFTGLVEVGENSGTLPGALYSIADHIEKTHELKAKVRNAMLYPLIIMCATIGVTAYLVFVLLPQITPLFASLDVELPIATRLVIAISAFALSNKLALSIGLLATVVGGFLLSRVPPIRAFLHRSVLRVPVVGILVMRVEITQFSRVVGTLIKSGITIVEAFRIAGSTMGNLSYRDALATIADSIQEGANVSTYLTMHRELFPPFVTQMIAVGEETGKLDESFLFLATFSEKEVDDQVKTLTTVLEPLMMIVVGAIVGFIAVAVISPIYELTKGVQPGSV
ncbi:hypothetical protein A2856_04245 [Candidatus Uhrbacteria bacterium RIFCSPHIGHO2_01_FULL_63_20]|uniref:Type II secretion system protein GspF domain-containing protein n=1 Tax=Candidatus Uhrbacteria bacterium RIFCSPHIGHO2_01_FULL_63_20 TaxID=1802385 RepID=A0A1F7TMN9_9BACT|nr:MAG: hypothetical protein A2856_04245 [Candidatus Uhrbacteria bacterium RIFCSPHIGHO2_01_FULL_63_20]